MAQLAVPTGPIVVAVPALLGSVAPGAVVPGTVGLRLIWARILAARFGRPAFAVVFHLGAVPGTFATVLVVVADLQPHREPGHEDRRDDEHARGGRDQYRRDLR
jgi:hypothetical protein